MNKKNILLIMGCILTILLLFGCDFSPDDKNNDDYGFLQMPNNVKATANSTSSITVTWNSVSDAAGYHVYRSLTLSGAYSFLESVTSTVFIDTKLSSNTIYYYKISAFNDKYVSSLSAAANARTKQPPPKSPTIRDVSAMANSIAIHWWHEIDRNGYRIYRSLDNDDYNAIGSTASQTYIDSGLSPNTTYYYKITTFHISNGETPLSDVIPIILTTLSIDAGKSWNTAIDIISLNATDGTCGHFPEGWNEIWYKFTRDGPGTLFARDIENSITRYTGNIVVDVVFMYESQLYYVALENGSKLESINIGRGSTDSRNIRISNWGGTYYVVVRPFADNVSNRGTFEMFFLNYITSL